MRVRVSCEDRYEAQKLASLIYVRDSEETNIVSVLNAVENELVIALRDMSAHSILMGDMLQVEAFADFVQSVIDGEHRIVRAAASGEEVEIEKA